MEDFSRYAIRVSVAQICQTIGWSKIQLTPLEVLTDLLQEYVLSICKLINSYATIMGQTEANLSHLSLAFNDMNINYNDLKHFVDNFDSGCVLRVAKYPLAKESHLNSLKPGSKEVLTRPIHIHEHLPPMLSHFKEISRNIRETSPELSTHNNSVQEFDSQNEEEINQFREVKSVLMTTSGYLSSAVEGKLPDVIPAEIDPNEITDIKVTKDKENRAKKSLNFNKTGHKKHKKSKKQRKIKKPVEKILLETKIESEVPVATEIENVPKMLSPNSKSEDGSLIDVEIQSPNSNLCPITITFNKKDPLNLGRVSPEMNFDIKTEKLTPDNVLNYTSPDINYIKIEEEFNAEVKFENFDADVNNIDVEIPIMSGNNVKIESPTFINSFTSTVNTFGSTILTEDPTSDIALKKKNKKSKKSKNIDKTKKKISDDSVKIKKKKKKHNKDEEIMNNNLNVSTQECNTSINENKSLKRNHDMDMSAANDPVSKKTKIEKRKKIKTNFLPLSEDLFSFEPLKKVSNIVEDKKMNENINFVPKITVKNVETNGNLCENSNFVPKIKVKFGPKLAEVVKEKEDKKHKLKIKPVLQIDEEMIGSMAEEVSPGVLGPADPVPADNFVSTEGASPSNPQLWICPSCNRPDDGSPMIACDECDLWFHWLCVGIRQEVIGHWFCKVCLVRREQKEHREKKKKHKKKKKSLLN